MADHVRPRRGRPPSSSSGAELLDAAERLMGERGYAATPVSAICREAGVAVTSLYHHFGSKEGLLARVMERGADRWFEALPSWDELPGAPPERAEAMLRGAADAVAGHPLFLRLFYLLSLEATEDEAASEIVRRVRRRAYDAFADAAARTVGHLRPDLTRDVADGVVDELARFALATSDGCFFASQLEPGGTDLPRMYAHLGAALVALIPRAEERQRAATNRGGPT